MKFEELKARVYQLAEVNSTRQLKAKYEEIRPLDMRRKVSWEKAFTVVQPSSDDFQSWLNNPPAEYQELFAEIESVSQSYNQQSTEAKQLAKEMTETAGNLESIAQECQDEANQLQQEVKAARRIAKRAELN